MVQDHQTPPPCQRFPRDSSGVQKSVLIVVNYGKTGVEGWDNAAFTEDVVEYKDLEIVYKDIDELKPFKRNPKEHPEVQIKNIAKSIEKYGWRSPLLINMNTGDIIAGHGRVLAARRLGIDRIPCIDGSDMTEDQIAEYRYLDNKLNESDWNMEVLSEDWPTMDFSDFDLDWGIEEEKSDAAVEDDYEIEVPEEPKTKLGDVYQLGPHRLMCGDSTSVEDVQTLMGGGTGRPSSH